MSETYLLSLDISISGIKAGIFLPDGNCLALVNHEYLQIPEGLSVIEFDPEVFWQTVIEIIRQVVRKAQVDPESITAISISSHGETLFFLDADGRPTRQAILTLDARAEAEAATLREIMDRETIYRITGQPDVLPIWPAVKIAWLKQNDRAAYRRTSHYLLPQGFVIYRLCSQPADDPSVLATTLLLDINTQDWSPPLLEFAGVHPSQLPRIQSPGTVVGTITESVAELTGLSPRTKVIMGALDQVCAAVAAGNIYPGILTESTGSVLALVATAQTPIYNGLPVYPHAVPGLFTLLPWHQTGGLVLKWFKDRFSEKATGEEAYEKLMKMAEGIPPGSDGLIMLPHLEGIQFPQFLPGDHGAFIGIGLKHGRAHFVRSILESVAFLIREDIELLKSAGLDIQNVVSLGGGSKSYLWLQIKSDVCQLPFQTLQTEQAALLGAAMLAAVGSGIYQDLSTAFQSMTRPGKTYLPQKENADLYERAYLKYKKLNEKLLGNQ